MVAIFRAREAALSHSRSSGCSGAGCGPGEIRHVAVDVRQGHRRREVQVHVGDVDLVQGFVRQRWVPGLLEIAEEIPQVQKYSSTVRLEWALMVSWYERKSRRICGASVR